MPPTLPFGFENSSSLNMIPTTCNHSWSLGASQTWGQEIKLVSIMLMTEKPIPPSPGEGTMASAFTGLTGTEFNGVAAQADN